MGATIPINSMTLFFTHAIRLGKSIVVLSLLLFVTACGGGGGGGSQTQPPAGGGPITPVNAAPVANAGSAKSITVENNVTLTGTGSDSDNDTLSYSWTLISAPSSSNLTLSNPNSANINLIPDVVGDYTLSLVVNDGVLDSVADTVVVTANAVVVVVPMNNAPVANAGVDQSVTAGETVVLSATSSSDIDGDPLTYSWIIVQSPPSSTAVLSSNTLANSSFDADVAGDYIVQLVVNDGTVDSAVDKVTVSADVLNLAPVANAGTDQSSAAGLLITLSGALSSDPNGDLITYTWSLLSAPSENNTALSNPNAVAPTFVANVAGNYVFNLVVSDGQLVSAIDSVTIVITASNAAPVANAGIDQNVTTGTLVNVNGAGSSDSNGDALSYQWSLISQPQTSNVTLIDSSESSASFTPIIDGLYILQLMVNDGVLDSEADTLTITAQTANSLPIANAGSDDALLVGQLVSLSGQNSTDADNDVLTYQWSFVSIPINSNVTFDDATIVNPQFSPDLAGSYVLNLTVNDGTADSVADTVVIDVVLPQITLQRLSRGLEPVYEDVPFPFDNQFSVVTTSINALNPPNFYVLDRFKFTTIGQAYTITGIGVGSTVPGFTAFIQDIQTGLVLTDNTVIPADTEFDFVIGALFTSGAQISLRFTFEITETNETFDITYNYTTTFI